MKNWIEQVFFYHFPKYHMKILLDFNAKLGRENTFKLTIGNESLHQDSNNNGVLSTTYRILSNILLSRLTPYAEEIIGERQCGFRRNRSTTDHIFCIRQILEKKWE
jgi:hypothetical protein